MFTSQFFISFRHDYFNVEHAAVAKEWLWKPLHSITVLDFSCCLSHFSKILICISPLVTFLVFPILYIWILYVLSSKSTNQTTIRLVAFRIATLHLWFTCGFTVEYFCCHELRTIAATAKIFSSFMFLSRFSTSMTSIHSTMFVCLRS